MKAMLRPLLALTALMGAFYLSISYQFGDPGWRLEFQAREAAAQPDKEGDYDLKSLSILNRAVVHIKENYVDPSRINERKMIGAAMEEVQRAVAELLVDVERDSEGVPTELTVRVDKASHTFKLGDVGNIWQMSFKFKDVFKFIQANLRHHRKLRDIEYAAINGMLSTLDPHSILLRPEDYREMKLSTRGKFGGLGIVISIRDGVLTIVNPIEDTPASRAKLKAGDRIVQIGLDSTVNMALSDAVDMLRGEPNTSVDLWVMRDAWKTPRKFTLKRGDIKVKSVASRRLPSKVGLIRLRNFQNTTRNELDAAIASMRKKGPLKGIILDLRGNPGGLLDQAIKVSDLFIENGPLVTTVGFGDKMREPKMATRSGTSDISLVVLANGFSASASEIVAGALKNHKRALVIGQQTFGKGSVQVIYDNRDDSALKLTIAQYLTPGDLSIQSVGISPDIATVPVVVEEDETDLFRSLAIHNGEVDLPSHLDHESSKVAKARKPELTVRYLQESALQKKIRENPNDLIVDFDITLAESIILKTKAKRRDGMLAEGRPIIDARIAKEEQRIAAALAKRGVDWNVPAGVKGTPKAEVTITTDQPGPLKAGETLTVTATVKNTGDAPYVRLRALSKSDNELFSGHEFLFGAVLPGESKTWSLPIKMPKSALTRRDEVHLEFSAETDAVPDEATFKVSVEQLPRPRFAMTYRLDDRKKGNGDGLLQVGEEVELIVNAENVGVGKSFKLLGSLRNDAKDPKRSAFIRRGRIEEDGLAPHEQKAVRFGFKIKDIAGSESSLSLLITLLDNEIREATTEKIELTVVDKTASLEAGPFYLTPRTGTHIELRAHYTDQAALTAQVAGGVLADGRFNGWYRVPTKSGFLWTQAEGVKVSKTKIRTGQIEPAPPKGPPVITLKDTQLYAAKSAKTVTVDGEVTQDQKMIKDLLIYVNSKKVYFKSSIEGSPQNRLPFSAEVPLEKGVNRITVIARQDDESSSRHTVIVSRELAE